jgi:hypothetical protein
LTVRRERTKLVAWQRPDLDACRVQTKRLASPGQRIVLYANAK